MGPSTRLALWYPGLGGNDGREKREVRTSAFMKLTNQNVGSAARFHYRKMCQYLMFTDLPTPGKGKSGDP